MSVNNCQAVTLLLVPRLWLSLACPVLFAAVSAGQSTRDVLEENLIIHYR